MQRTFAKLLDTYAIGVAGWVLAWKLFRDRWGLLGMANAWAFWLLSTALPIGLIRFGRHARRLIGKKLLGGGLVLGAAGSALLAVRAGNLLSWPRSQNSAIPARHEERGSPLHILSFNLLKHNRDVTPFVEEIRRESPDVVLLQELVPDLAEGFETELRDEYPYRYLVGAPGAAGLGVVSRYPFATTGEWHEPGIERFALRVTLLLPSGPVDVYTVHLVAPAGDHLMDTGLTANFRLREAQVQHLLDEIETRGSPAVIMGDFNMSESNDAYRIASSRLRDAWKGAGRGIRWTWPRNMQPFADLPMMPLLRLDYCFHTDKIQADDVRVLLGATESDHCPLSARLRA